MPAYVHMTDRSQTIIYVQCDKENVHQSFLAQSSMREKRTSLLDQWNEVCAHQDRASRTETGSKLPGNDPMSRSKRGRQTTEKLPCTALAANAKSHHFQCWTFTFYDFEDRNKVQVRFCDFRWS